MNALRLRGQLLYLACCPTAWSCPESDACDVQADEEADSLMEELQEMDAYADRPLTGTSTAEGSFVQVTCSSLSGNDQCWRFKDHHCKQCLVNVMLIIIVICITLYDDNHILC